MAQVASPFPPDCAARFAAVRVLATGGFGAVWLAEHRGLARPAAIKLLLAGAAAGADQLRRFQDEARITAALKHPHVIEVMDLGAEHGIPWIAYAFHPGASLRAELDDAPRGLPLERAVRIVREVAEGLEAAHAAGILHRDVKPANVLTADDGRCVVTDFGIAKWTQSGLQTATGVILGTPAYMAPELITGTPAAVASDVYALGALCFELLTGRPPYVDPAPIQVLHLHAGAPIPQLASFAPDLPRVLQPFIERALAKRPPERHATPRELANELATLVDGLSAGPLEPASPRASRPTRQAAARTQHPARTLALTANPLSRARSGALAGGIALALACVAALALHRTSPATPPSPPASAPRSPAARAPLPVAPYLPAFGLYEQAYRRLSVDHTADRTVEAIRAYIALLEDIQRGAAEPASAASLVVLEMHHLKIHVAPALDAADLAADARITAALQAWKRAVDRPTPAFEPMDALRDGMSEVIGRLARPPHDVPSPTLAACLLRCGRACVSLFHDSGRDPDEGERTGLIEVLTGARWAERSGLPDYSNVLFDVTQLLLHRVLPWERAARAHGGATSPYDFMLLECFAQRASARDVGTGELSSLLAASCEIFEWYLAAGFNAEVREHLEIAARSLRVTLKHQDREICPALGHMLDQLGLRDRH